MPAFKKKPIVVEAVRLTRRTMIETLEGALYGEIGDWLITGVNGEQYPCKHDVFLKTYEPDTQNARVYLSAMREP